MTAIHRTDPGSDYAVSILCQIFLGFDQQLDQGGLAARAEGLETGLRNRCAGDIPVAGRELERPMQYRTFGPVAGRIVKSGRSAVAEFSKLTNRAGTGSASGFLQNDQTRAQPLRTAKAGAAGAGCWLLAVWLGSVYGHLGSTLAVTKPLLHLVRQRKKPSRFPSVAPAAGASFQKAPELERDPTMFIDGETGVCILCGGTYVACGNNPYPLASLEDGKCCHKCNVRVVQARLDEHWAQDALPQNQRPISTAA